MPGNYWACQDLTIWYSESWRHGKVCRGLAKIYSTILVAWQENIGLAEMSLADLQKAILAAWQEIVGLAKTSEFHTQNHSGHMAMFCRRLAKILKSWRHKIFAACHAKYFLCLARFLDLEQAGGLCYKFRVA